MPSTTDTSYKIASRGKRIWIDLENSPHVPFFKPIIWQLENRGYSVMLTARDCFQVCDLADLFGLQYKRFGRHYGKHTAAKLAGLGIRVIQMTPTILSWKPDLAISHGSRSLFLLASLLRIPTVTIFDYEHAKWVKCRGASWVMAPEVIPEEAVCAIGIDKSCILRYPGIKEDVYASLFRPDPSIKDQIGLNGKELIVTVRPPATEAHYHNPQSDVLFDAVIRFLSSKSNVRIVLLPRNDRQAIFVKGRWPDLFSNGKIRIPEHVVDGLNLIWHSDLVISGGGTMNREAAALGVPVYSIFRGKIGAVDHYLSNKGRLVLLESVQDLQTKIVLARRDRTPMIQSGAGISLKNIVDQIVAIMESKCPAQSQIQ
jgi:uncharacterized protein